MIARPTPAPVLTDMIHYYAGFVQDNFRVNSKLTLNFGFRLEHESGVEGSNNALLVGFNQNATNVLPLLSRA